MDKTTEERLRRLEAIEAIRQCVYAYALAGDRANDGKIIAELFTADGVYDATGFGRFAGRDNVVRGLAEIGKNTVVWSFHVPGGPLIKLSDDGNTAKAFWWIWVPVKLRGADGIERPHWGAGHYNADLAIEDGRWKFRNVLFQPKLQTPFEGPWTQVPGTIEWPGN